MTTTHYGLHPAGHGDTEHKGPLETCTAPDCAERANAERARQSGIRALTVKQPFAFAIAEGFKPIENRSRRTNHRGQIYLHTSKAPQRGVHIVRYSRDAAARLDELGGSGNFWNALQAVPSKFYTPAPTLACSAVIATARITGCHFAGDGCTPACAAWGQPDAWHWELADARPLTTPIAINGNLGLWIPPWGLIEVVRTQIDTPATVEAATLPAPDPDGAR